MVKVPKMKDCMRNNKLSINAMHSKFTDSEMASINATLLQRISAQSHQEDTSSYNKPAYTPVVIRQSEVKPW